MINPLEETTWDAKASGAAAARRYVESIKRTVVSAGVIGVVREMYADGVKQVAELLTSENELERLAGEYWLAYYSTAKASMSDWVNGRG